MKKRIICLILAVVMLSLSLVGCVYSFQNDELGQYVKYNEVAFKNALKNIVVEDGDFTTDPETREKKVHDAIYALLASNATNKDKKSSGELGEHDMFYYCYYATYVNEQGKVVQLVFDEKKDSMSTSNFKSIQLGNKLYSTTLEEEINKAAADYTFTTDKSYSTDSNTSNTVKEGDVAAITYTIVESVNNRKFEVKLEIAKLEAAGANPVYAKLIGLNVGKVAETDDKHVLANDLVIDDATITKGTTITIKDAKVNYILKGEEFTTVTEKTYKEGDTKKLKDVYGNEVAVADEELTYHVYAYRFSTVDEYNATNVIKLIYGANLTKDNVKDLFINGSEMKDKTEDDHKIYFENFAVEGYTADKDSTVFDTLVDKLLEAFKDVTTKKSTLTSAETAKNTASSDYTTAKNEADKNPSSDSAKETLKEKEKALKEKTEAYDKAKKAFDEAETTRDELIYILVSCSKTKLDAAKKAWEDAKTAEEAAKKAYEDAKKAVDEDNKKANYDKAVEEEEKAKEAYEKAVKAEEDAEKAYNEAAEADKEAKKTAWDAAIADVQAKNTAWEEKTAAKNTADEAYKAAQGTTEDELKAWNTAKAATEAAFAKYKTADSDSVPATTIVKGYEEVKYNELQDKYREEMKEKIALKVLEAIVKNVEVKKYPSDAVDEAYDRLLNNYKYDFYNGKYTDASGKTVKDEEGREITNYTKYNGSFKEFLIASVTEDYSKVDNYSDAKKALTAWAQEKVAPVLQFSFIAEKYGQEYTDDEFDAYKEDEENAYKSDELYYGEAAVRNGLQFEKLMNYFLESEEKVEGKVTTNEYKNITVVVSTEK